LQKKIRINVQEIWELDSEVHLFDIVIKMNHFSAFYIHFNDTFSDCPQLVVDGWGRRRFRAPVA
jgi:hypothetical protein